MAFDVKENAKTIASSVLGAIVNAIFFIATFGLWYFVPISIKGKIHAYFIDIVVFVTIAQTLASLVASVVGWLIAVASPDTIFGLPYKIIIGVDPSQQVLQKTFGFLYFVLLSTIALLPMIKGFISSFKEKKDDKKDENVSIFKLHTKAIKNIFSWKGFGYSLIVLGLLQTAYIIRLQSTTNIMDVLTNFSIIEKLNPAYWMLWTLVWSLSFLLAWVVALGFSVFSTALQGVLEQATGGGVIANAINKLTGGVLNTAEATLQKVANVMVSNIGSVFLGLITFTLEPTILTFGKGIEIFPGSQWGYWLAFSLPLLKLVSGVVILRNREKLEKWSSPFTDWLSKTFKKAPGVEALGLVTKEKPGKEKILLDEYKDYPHIETLITALKHGTDDQKNAAITTLLELIQNDKNIVRMLRMTEALAKEYKDVADSNQLVVKLIIDLAKGEKK